MDANALEARIAELEARFREFLSHPIRAEDGQTHGCTYGCSAACPDSGDCTYGCTYGCTQGCTAGCGAAQVLDRGRS